MNWRSLPPTQAQIDVLYRWHRSSGQESWRFVAPKTRGEASDIITSVVKHMKSRAEADEFDPPNDMDADPMAWGHS
jgi:hypothetical protein